MKKRRHEPPAYLILRHLVQKIIQAPGMIQGGKIVEAAHMQIVDENLRHGPPPGDHHHFLKFRRIEIDPDFLDLGDPFRMKQAFGCRAKRTQCGAVHANLGHNRKMADKLG